MPTDTFYNLNKEKKDRILNAAIFEFSNKIYEQVNLSDIIKKAKIPRGSFYQYFKDKEDLYLYLISVIRETKINYLSSSLINDEDIPFLDLVKIMFEDGINFAINHPKYVMILDLLLNNKNQLYEKLMKDNIKIAKKIYKEMIDKDKKLGRINKDIDTEVFAEIIVNLTTNISLDNLDLENPKQSYKIMIEKIEKILNILKKGVQNNE
ncbi:MAG: TetR/AcrR family transcriptional regulator [Candidatus Izimaplasma sp.]|nr:TetR/AcrR family transcriptional regulator [Candidatus Izimaplasma bacterium]